MTVSSKTFIKNSTISGNIALRGGGVLNGGEIELTNCTISGNIADAGAGTTPLGDGGAIFGTGITKLISSTVAENCTSTPGSADLQLTTAFLQNTIVNAVGSGCGGRDSVAACINNSSTSSFTSQGYNIEWPPPPMPPPPMPQISPCGLTLVTNDLLGVDPMLGPLANNGGPTWTHALRLGSPAIDAAPVFSAPAIDQRGVRRPQFFCFSFPCNWIPQSFLVDIGHTNASKLYLF
jgi:hypothetical protein